MFKLFKLKIFKAQFKLTFINLFFDIDFEFCFCYNKKAEVYYGILC